MHRTTTGILLLLVATSSDGAVEDVSSLSHVPRKQIQEISRQIDELVEHQLADSGLKPNPLASDEVFLRRIYLDIAGRIPTLEEATSFLSAKGKNKRAELVDELLDSPAYTSHAFNYWADVLRIKTRLQGGNPGLPYIEFVKASLAANKPYDEFVRELLVAEGPALERDNGATGYYLRDQGMPEDNMANTVRVFLGIRLECAQCHDHPFDEWTQREFFEMVAFTGGMRTRMPPSGTLKTSVQLRQQLRQSDADAKVKQAAQRLLRPLSYGVSGGGTGLARLPDSYQYDNGEPNEIVTAKTLFDHQELVQPVVPRQPVRRRPRRQNNKRFANQIPGARDIGSREAFADWLTAPENPLFTQVIANRLWKRAMGLGLIDPVDDLSRDTPASNSDLLAYLTQQMTELEYDMKQFQRAIYNSQTYQRVASADEVQDYLKYHFPGPLLRRLTAEQLWDSFLTLAVPNLDEKENPRNQISRFAMYGDGDLYAGYERVQGMTVDEILTMAEEEVALRSNPQARRERVRQAMMSVDQQRNPYADDAAELRRRVTVLKRLQQQAKRKRRPRVARQLQEQIRDAQTTLRHLPARTGADLVRASELPSPAPPGHFLREFGQSDRETIENANAEPAVNQVLSLMNGTIEKRIISNPRTVLMTNLVAADSPVKKINTVFLSMLSRYPTRDERSTWLAAARADGQEAANDLIWTLANTSEFMFVR